MFDESPLQCDKHGSHDAWPLTGRLEDQSCSPRVTPGQWDRGGLREGGAKSRLIDAADWRSSLFFPSGGTRSEPVNMSNAAEDVCGGNNFTCICLTER